MTDTLRLQLPLLAAAQAQKHVTHNDALVVLDAVIQLAVTSRALNAPPASPVEGARYLVPAAATGAWTGRGGSVAVLQDGAWTFRVPVTGWIAWVADEQVALVFNNTGWQPLTALNPAAVVGVNATADTTNRLSVSAPATLFTHAGAGHQMKINKGTAADTASLLFQTGFSGRAEMGTTGDDRFHIKVSANGTTFVEAVVVDAATGKVSLPAADFTPTGASFTGSPRPATDNAMALGASGARWSAVWATNGVIQTSDVRDKADITALSVQQSAALVDAIKPVTFRWKAGGDAAPDLAGTVRHAGFLAQEMRAALDASGMDIAACGVEDPAHESSRHWLRPDQLIPVLWAALRQTRDEVAALRQRLGQQSTGEASSKT